MKAKSEHSLACSPHGLGEIVDHSFIVRHEKFGGLIIDKTVDRQLKMNHSTLFAAERLLGGFEPEQIVSEILSHFDVDEPDRVAAQVHEIRTVLKDHFGGRSSGSTECRTELFCGEELPEVLQAPVDVFWEVTYQCNLRCLHCYSGSGLPAQDEMNTHEALRVIGEFAGLGVHKLIIGGGEPFCRRDMIEILEAMLSHGLTPVIVTNGTLLTESIIADLQRLGVLAISVSLDGPSSETNDLFRGKQGSFSSTFASLGLLADSGITVEVQTTVNTLNVDQLHLMPALLKSVNVRRWTLRSLTPSGRILKRPNLIPTHEQYARLAIDLKRLCTQEHPEIDIHVGFPWAMTVEEEFQRAENPDRPLSCGAGFTTVGMTPEGRLKPCSFLEGSEWLSESVRECSVKSLWDRSPVFEPFRQLTASSLAGECFECGLLFKGCNGGCRAAAYNVKRDFCARDPQCRFDFGNHNFLTVEAEQTQGCI